MWDMTHSYVWHDSLTRVTRLAHICDMTQSYVWHDSLIRVTWLTECVTWLTILHMHIRKLCPHIYTSNDSLICVTWVTYMCDMSHLHVWHNSQSFTHVSCEIICIYINGLTHVCDMTHSCVWHDSTTCLIWHDRQYFTCVVGNHMCDMTHSYVWRDSLMCVTWFIHMWNATYSFTCATWHLNDVASRPPV